MNTAVTDTPTDLLLVQRHEAHLWLTLNRADKANAMTVALMEQLTDRIVEAGQDVEVQAILVTGAGDRIFCAGVDVREKPSDGDVARQRERRSKALAALQDAFMHTPKPVIAVLNGVAIGGGAMLALMADACVAADTAALSLPEIDLGIPTFSGSNILETIGGRALALDLIQNGRRMPAQEAAARGLVRTVSTAADLRTSATAMANVLGAKDSKTFAENKRWINRALVASLEEAREQHARHRAAAAH